MASGLADRGVRGACPGVHTPFLGLDGALVRIRLLGGVLSSEQLVTCADLAGAGGLEITSRANLQLRGIDPDDPDAAARTLVAAGLADPDPSRDERRNVLVGPGAGLDPDELFDVRPLGRELAERLAARTSGAAPKFGVLLDGGGRVHLRGRPFDLALGAVGGTAGPVLAEATLAGVPQPDRADDEQVLLEVTLAGALPPDRADDEPMLLVPAAAVGDLVDAVLDLCPSGGRVADAVAAFGRAALLDRLAACTGAFVAPRGHPRTAASGPPAVTGLHHQVQPGLVWCGATPLLGRLDPATARALAGVADTFGQGEIRLTPWRGVLVPGIPAARGPAAAAALERLGLATDPGDPVHSVVACAGRTGCASGLTDTQADGARLVARLRGLPPGERPAAVHLSGCPKACATREQLAVTLVGGPEPGRYDLYRAAPGTDGFGTLVGHGLDPGPAVDAALSAGGSV